MTSTRRFRRVVERGLEMVDGVLLLVDASEGCGVIGDTLRIVKRIGHLT